MMSYAASYCTAVALEKKCISTIMSMSLEGAKNGIVFFPHRKCNFWVPCTVALQDVQIMEL